MLATTTNVDSRPPDPAPALHNGHKSGEHVLSRELNGFSTPAKTLTCVIRTQPALKRGSARWEGRQRCDVGRSASPLVRRVHLPVRSKFLVREIDQVSYASMQQPLSRSIKAKSPKPSSWEDSSPSTSKLTANNQTVVKASRAPFIPVLTSRENARALSLKFWIGRESWLRRDYKASSSQPFPQFLLQGFKGVDENV